MPRYWQTQYDRHYTSSDFINLICVHGPVMQCPYLLTCALWETFTGLHSEKRNSQRSYLTVPTGDSRTVACRPLPQAHVHYRVSVQRHQTSVLNTVCAAPVSGSKMCLVYTIHKIFIHHNVVIMDCYCDKQRGSASVCSVDENILFEAKRTVSRTSELLYETRIPWPKDS